MRYPTQDPKYDIDRGRLINSSSGEPIRMDEPIFIFRAKDKRALKFISAYADECENDEHQQAVWDRCLEFEQYALGNPEKMGEPTTSKK